MTAFYIGERVVAHALWSSFRGMRGCVVRAGDPLYVLLDGDKQPICVHPREVIAEELPTEPHIGGAE